MGISFGIKFFGEENDRARSIVQTLMVGMQSLEVRVIMEMGTSLILIVVNQN